MSGATFIRFYASDWRSGCIGMTLAQEGLYIRLCAYIYETGRRLPLEDSAAAKFMGVHTNAYRKVRKELEALDVLEQHDDGWTVRRAELELANARSAQGKEADLAAARNADGAQHQDGGSPVAGQGTSKNTCLDTPPNTPWDTLQDTHLVFSENTNKTNGPKKELVVSNQERTDVDVSARATCDLLDGLQAKLEGAAGDVLEDYARAANLLSLSTPLMWLEQGCDLERDVLPAIRTVCGKRRGKGRISDWNYFTQAIANAKRDRERGLPPPTGEAAVARSSRDWTAAKAERSEKSKSLMAYIASPEFKAKSTLEGASK